MNKFNLKTKIMSIDTTKNQNHEDYILKDNTKTKFGAAFISIILVLLILAVVISGFAMNWW